jgi:parvulin-like peptidyl-prolyl isomerase
MASRTSLLLAALAALVAGVALAGCGGKKLSSGQIAAVCGVPVTQAQFDQFLAEGKAEFKLHKQPFPAVGTADYAALKGRIVGELVKEAAETERAGKLGVHVTDAQVEQNLKTTIVDNTQFKGSEAAFEKELKKEGLTRDEVLTHLRFGLVEKGAYDKLTAKYKVHDPEIKAYYEANKAQYVSRPSRQVRAIIVKSKAEALKLLAQLKAGADFTTLAKQHSLDPNAKATGGLQRVDQGTLTAANEKLLFGLAVGKVSQPVPLAATSWAIFKPLGPVQPGHTVPLSQVRLQIVQYLLQSKRQQAFATWQAGVQKNCTDKATYAKGYAPATTATTTTAAVTTTAG